jgi:hypothetical protein
MNRKLAVFVGRLLAYIVLFLVWTITEFSTAKIFKP